ncbi:MAG: hypothetical protein D6830_01375 [Ignavibacteria bacterium]|nr:MAG: hypothetical protein D6830_01375 [Ignavibacteria bacterium]
MEFIKKYRYIFSTVLGGIAGYAYYHFIGCNGGCLITGNPYISTVYGSVLGLLIGFPTKKRKEDGE